MPAGIHLLLGILLALFKRNWPEYKFGVVFGSILPDIDVVLTALVALFTFDTSFTSSESFTEIQQFLEYWHRSVSHSVIVIALLFILFLPSLVSSIMISLDLGLDFQLACSNT